MKLAVITDSSVNWTQGRPETEDLYVLDIPIWIDGETYVEGKNLTATEFYQKMEASKELPKTSQPSVAELEDILHSLPEKGYTHAIGIFLSSGISGFYQNIQYLKEEVPGLIVAFPDSKITSAPMGFMVENALRWAAEGVDFMDIVKRTQAEIDGTSAYILVDDLNHLVKGGRLSNGAAILGNLLSIKPILYFNKQGIIEVYEKVRTEKKATKRLLETVAANTADGAYRYFILEADAKDKAVATKQQMIENGVTESIDIIPLGGVVGTHLGAGAIAVGYTPIVD